MLCAQPGWLPPSGTVQATAPFSPATATEHHHVKPTLAKKWQRAFARFFDQLWVELVVGALIILSVSLTLLQFGLDASLAPGSTDARIEMIEQVNRAITLLFAVELTARFIAVGSWRRFLAEYWIDLLALLPLLRIFRAARAIRLLRLLRLLRMFGLVTRLATNFPYVLRRGAVEYLMVCGLLIMTVVFGTGAMMFFERPPDDQIDLSLPPEADGRLDFGEAFWFSIYSLFAGEPIPESPHTLGGRIVAVIIMFMGLTIFAMFTGTVSAFMVERLRTEGRPAMLDDVHDHIVICGWSSKAEIVIQEFQAAHPHDNVAIVVIAQFPDGPPALEGIVQKRVRFLQEDFTRVAALEQAGIHRAKTCIILADLSGGRGEQDADARTILAALTVEKLSPDVYTCAELHHRSYGTHLEMGRVNDYVVAGEHSAFLLAQAAMNRGLMDVLSELLTYQRGSQFYRLPIPGSWQGRDFFDLFVDLKRTANAIVVAVRTAAGEFHVNPTDYQFQTGDDIVVIARKEPKLKD